MTTALFNHIDTSTQPTGSSTKPWSKVDGGGVSFKFNQVSRPVHNLRVEAAKEGAEFGTDVSGFTTFHWPSREKDFVDDSAVRGAYYEDVEALLRADCERLPSNNNNIGVKNKVKKVVIFDHTIRRRDPDAPRGPVQQVHVDQTAAAAVARVRRHLPPDEAEDLLKNHRFQLINVWRPIGHAASDHPLAVVDWRTTSPRDFVPVDLLYPKRPDSVLDDDGDDRGREAKALRADDPFSTEGYEVRGETMGVAASENHRFYYVKDMTPDEVLLLKCYDSWGEGEPGDRNRGERMRIAVRTPHTAFVDPDTPADAKPRQSIEVRALVFYEQ
ncbi:hypothetical protein F5Y17DRAFT_432614 [Xylariaceae sp. FL0594]|nr:hypothetical protein F5Y17DRAFT_432614 [Xylariaceae sp. FL0594]